jgi:hypothetical protein
VPGVDNGGRVELYMSAENGISESVSVGVHWRSCSADQSANDIDRGFSGSACGDVLWEPGLSWKIEISEMG